MPTSVSLQSAPGPLITPAVERVTAWHRAQSMRQALVAVEAMRDDDDGAESIATTDSLAAPANSTGRPAPTAPQ